MVSYCIVSVRRSYYVVKRASRTWGFRLCCLKWQVMTRFVICNCWKIASNEDNICFNFIHYCPSSYVYSTDYLFEMFHKRLFWILRLSAALHFSWANLVFHIATLMFSRAFFNRLILGRKIFLACNKEATVNCHKAVQRLVKVQNQHKLISISYEKSSFLHKETDCVQNGFSVWRDCLAESVRLTCTKMDVMLKDL